MNASTFMDKQIMDLSRTKSDPIDTTVTNNNNEFMDLMNEEAVDARDSSSLNKKDDISSSFDFLPISRSNVGLQTLSSSDSPIPTSRVSDFVDSKFNSSPPLSSYGSVNPIEPNKTILEKAQKGNDSAILTEIDHALKKYTDNVLHAINSLGARLSNLEKTTYDLEHSFNDLKECIINNNGKNDGKMRQLENILQEVQTGVQDVKDKQEVMEGYVQLLKLQSSKVEKSSEIPNSGHVEPVQPPAVSALQQQQSNIQQFPNTVPQPAPPLPPNVPQQNIHPPIPTTAQFPPVQNPGVPHRDAFFSPPGPTPEAPSQHYQMPAPTQHQLHSPASAPQPQQHVPVSVPPYPQAPQPPQQVPPSQQHPSSVAAMGPPQFPPPFGHHQEESPFMPAQPYSQNLRPPTPQPSIGPPQSHQYYGSSPSLYEPPPSGRSSSGLSPYGSPSGSSEPYPYGGQVSHHGTGSPVKPPPHSPRGGGNNYPQIPTARIVPPAIPTATAVSGGSNTGGSGSRVPVDDLVDKVATMGFRREHVRATVRKLTDEGQSVDLNIVLDKLMNDGDLQPQRGWFGR